MYNILNNLIRICFIMYEIFKKKGRFDLLKVLYGVIVKLFVLFLFGYEYVYVNVYIFVLYILYYLMYLLLILI